MSCLGHSSPLNLSGKPGFTSCVKEIEQAEVGANWSIMCLYSPSESTFELLKLLASSTIHALITENTHSRYQGQ